MTRVHMPVWSAARIAARDSSTARATPCGYGWPSSPVRDTSTGVVCSRSRYLAYPWRCPLITGAARASASGRYPSSAATAAAPASSSRPVRPARNADASAALNTSTGTALPRFAADCRVLVISIRAVPWAGTNACSASGSDTSSNTSRQRSPSVSSQCRTVAAASVTPRPESSSVSPAASATAASPASRLPVSAPLTQATSRQPAASFARAYAAASCVAPRPCSPVIA